MKLKQNSFETVLKLFYFSFISIARTINGNEFGEIFWKVYYSVQRRRAWPLWEAGLPAQCPNATLYRRVRYNDNGK